MAKQSGLGDRLIIGNKDLSSDTQSIGNVGGSIATLDVTSIDKSAMERIGGLRDGRIAFVSFFNPDVARSHLTLSALPTSDVVCSYLRGTTLGNPAASLVAKQVNYDPTRGNDGSFTMAVEAQANGYGLTWGRQLTAGLRTDTAATLGATVDTVLAASFGWRMYLHVTAFTGTDVTIKVQDSADGTTWADLAGAVSNVITGLYAQHISSAVGAVTVRRYVRAVTTTTGGFTSATFAVNFSKNESAVVY